MNLALPLRMLSRDWRGAPEGGAGAPRLRGDATLKARVGPPITRELTS
jgi:hypothetical protein